MKNEQPKNNTAVPVIIIGLVLVAVIGGAWYLYSQSKPANNSNVKPGATPVKATTVNPNAPLGANPPNMLGSPTAAVTVEEFADFQCPTCGSTHPIMKEIQSTYGSKIRFIYREYPLPMHDKGYDAAVAAEAAGLQGKFWAMQDQLFSNQQAWSNANATYKQLWSDYAQKIGLDVQQWQNDVAGIAAKSRVDLDLQRGKALNVSSTPSIFINGELVPFPELNVAGIRKIIDAKLQEAGGAQSSGAATSQVNTNSK
jgi:protein-disulfide isomerase